MWIVYEFLLLVSFLFYLPKAFWRKRLPHRGWSMRLGRYPQAILTQLQHRPTIWIHAVSVGEVMAAQPLVAEFSAARPDHAVVVSTVTPAGFAAASRLLGQAAVIIYGPLDFHFIVRRAFVALQPQLVVLVESELWPVLIHHASQRNIPVVVVNGRISARAFRRYQWVRPLLRSMLHAVQVFLMQTEQDAARITAMGAPAERVRVVGSLKWDASVSMRPSVEKCAELASRLGIQSGEVMLVAGSTHRGEEDAVLDALHALRAQGLTARLILAPRHLERLAEVEALAARRGLAVQRASTIAAPLQRWDVALVDTIGTLPVYYGLATLVVIGGSLIPHGGQNPLEAASLGKPVVFGPFMHNFADIAQRLLEHGAAAQVRDRTELIELVRRLCEQPAQAQAMGQRAKHTVEQCGGVARQTIQLLQSYYAPGSSAIQSPR